MPRCRDAVARAAGLLALAALAACAPAPLVAPPDEAPALPLRTLDGAARYQIKAAQSTVYARVFRGGRLEKLGHNHVVLFRDVRGDVFLGDTPRESLFDLVIATPSAAVDPPAIRQRQGSAFETEITDDARVRTRDNMLGEAQLDAAGHPYIQVSSTSLAGSFERPRVTVDLTIRGVTRSKTVPVSLELDEGGRLGVEGELALEQTEFGIEPFSTLGGALKVEDRVELVFSIAAVKRGRYRAAGK